MKIIIGLLLLSVFGCTEIKKQQATSQQDIKIAKDANSFNSDSFTDPRDGEKYSVVTIDGQIWMAENLRYNIPGSWLNADNPSVYYGRLYSACRCIKDNE